MTSTVGIVVFPGSNCEHDVAEALAGLGAESRFVWHGDRSLGDVGAVVLPGGFAHGDYLRPGAIARFSPVMAAIEAFAAAGGPVIGICNGFQVLTEAGLLPGALRQNRGLKFLCTSTRVRVDSSRSVLTSSVPPGTVLDLPINHFSGSYSCQPDALAELRAEERIVLRYADNPNGSIDDIAGICSPGGNVVGLMPHPERACDPLGSMDGQALWAGLLASLSSGLTGAA
ncbi:MAG: phosphoribosylformylglycinamidine synthase subunit PurQ [Actinomycetota bacterium]|nr:phosphoribosylformylglycinamidine synthase subunit PurQ [Actinomycetota bacterium]